MKIRTKISAFATCLVLSFSGFTQRIYSPHSVLASNTWYKIAVRQPGVYKIDLNFLNSLGISTSNIPSSSIRIFGNGGHMLSESNSGPWIDDIKENAIMIVDGADGVLNGTDHILFYASGPDEWRKDSLNQRFSHRKNIYADHSYYFISIGGNGKRIADAPLSGTASVTVNSFSERNFHELDSLNFLASGKEWYGEELGDLPGRSLTRNLNIATPGLSSGNLTLQASCVARSVGIASRFDIRINSQPVGQLLINSITGGVYDPVANSATGIFTGTSSGNSSSISFNYVPGSFNSQGWINWFEWFYRRGLSMSGTDQLPFRDWSSVGNNVAGFVIANANSSTQVWDITDPLSPMKMQGQLAGSDYRFTNSANSLHEYIAFNNTNFLIPVGMGRINNQDLHDASPADMIIVTHSSLLSEANRLANIHQQHNGQRSKLVSTEQIFNEFGSGSPDPAAIRDYLKMYYDRFNNTPADRLKYLLLFGDASFDYKSRISSNTSLVPAYQNDFSLDPLATYASDDFFGFLDDNEDINSGLIINLLDVGIGRVPAKNAAEAKNFVDKVADYLSPGSLGPWRNNMTFLADDEDNNLHLQDAEIITSTGINTAPVFNFKKIYLDAFQQESGPGGSSYPLAVQSSNNQVYSGNLIWNYNGHGGSSRLAEETILDQAMINSWTNEKKLPLFITATCDFAPYDNPAVNSIGENLLLRPKTGGIALMTTTRPVFAFSNRIMNDNYIRFALQADANGKYRSLGEAMKEAKNFTYQSFADIANNRKFTLLGDPSLTLAFPSLKIRTTRINSIPVSQPDTLSSTEKVSIEGEVTDQAGNLLIDFNGSVYPTLFDKPLAVQTIGNDPSSQPVSFNSQENILFRGKASVVNGKFQFSFKMPKDINYQYGHGKLSLYAEDGLRDANGFFSNFFIGGVGNNAGNDNEGPRIKLFLNDENFANGGLSDQQPLLIVKLTDSSGINTAGTGIDHDIVATLDNDNRKYFILNNFYEAEADSYQKGSVRFRLPELSPGPHTIKVKAWDVLNNSSEAILDFVVADDGELSLSHVLNYPNPFTSSTRFFFEHNKPGQNLSVSVEIMTITGRVVKMISRQVVNEGNRSSEIEWDGRDEYGNRLGRGVYLYKLRVQGSDRKKKEVIEKLVIL